MKAARPTTLLALSQQLLHEHKAEQIIVLDVRGFALADYMVVASGRSRRQVPALARKLVEGVKQQGFTPLGVEEDGLGEWILVDLGEIIVHIMHPETREYYQLESLWAERTAPAQE